MAATAVPARSSAETRTAARTVDAYKIHGKSVLRRDRIDFVPSS